MQQKPQNLSKLLQTTYVHFIINVYFIEHSSYIVSIDFVCVIPSNKFGGIPSSIARTNKYLTYWYI